MRLERATSHLWSTQPIFRSNPIGLWLLFTCSCTSTSHSHRRRAVWARHIWRGGWAATEAHGHKRMAVETIQVSCWVQVYFMHSCFPHAFPFCHLCLYNPPSSLFLAKTQQKSAVKSAGCVCYWSHSSLSTLNSSVWLHSAVCALHAVSQPHCKLREVSMRK